MNILRVKRYAPWILAGIFSIMLNWLGSVYANIIYPVFAFPAARCAGFFFNATPFFSANGVIKIPLANSSIAVTPDCSAYGFFCIVIAIFIVLFGRFKWQRSAISKIVVIVFIAYFVTIITNSLRIVSAYKVHLFTANIFPDKLQNIVHLSVGIAVFLTVLFILYLFLERKECYDSGKQ